MLKTFWDKVKEYFFEAVLAVSLVLGGLVALLLSKVTRQQKKIDSLETEIQFKEANAEYEKQKETAADAEKEYQRVRDFYKRLINGDSSDK